MDRDGFGIRICNALGETPKRLAQRLGLSYKHDVEPILYVDEGKLVDSDIDDVYNVLARAVDERLGMLMAAREALQRKIHADRVRRAARIERFKR